MSEVVLYARRVDSWMRSGGRTRVAEMLGIGSRHSGVIGRAVDGRGRH
jgi:hypothetical protein